MAKHNQDSFWDLFIPPNDWQSQRFAELRGRSPLCLGKEGDKTFKRSATMRQA
jgi:hypothetical protein